MLAFNSEPMLSKEKGALLTWIARRVREREREREIIARACSQYVTHGVRACTCKSNHKCVCLCVRAWVVVYSTQLRLTLLN